MNNQLFTTVLGAYLAGWMLPELIFMLSPNFRDIKRIPYGMNFMCAAAAALIAYGAKAA